MVGIRRQLRILIGSSFVCTLMLALRIVDPRDVMSGFGIVGKLGSVFTYESTETMHSFDAKFLAKNPMKKILLWNPFFGEPDYGVGLKALTGWGTAAFTRTNCPYTCYLANDQSQVDEADAVVIHAYNMGPKFQNATIPPRSSKKQIFVFFIIESQERSYKGFQNTGFSFVDRFNLTFSFLDHPETDIYIPLGGLEKMPTPEPKLIPSLYALRKKPKLVAWFVSNCNAASARLEYARELAKYTQVDIYGQCGNLSCPKGELACFKQTKQDYTFYLSFENSFCEGYATEKLFRTLQSTMIPIVYGGADYNKLLHAKSHIDVRDFASPRHLGKYLNQLKRNPARLQEYLTWKGEYFVQLEGEYKARGFCRLCTILNTKNYPYKTKYDPVSYWNPSKTCKSRDEEMKMFQLKR